MISGCEQCLELLFEPEETLSEADRKALHAHLNICSECRAERDLFLESWDALGDAEEELEPCPLLRAKVWEKIRHEECRPKPLVELSPRDLDWPKIARSLSAAAAALLLGFGLGRTMRPAPVPPSASVVAARQCETQPLDPDLIQLASQEGFSVEIFPESSDFSPLDSEIMSALATDAEARNWLNVNRGDVVPLQYISRQTDASGPTP